MDTASQNTRVPGDWLATRSSRAGDRSRARRPSGQVGSMWLLVLIVLGSVGLAGASTRKVVNTTWSLNANYAGAQISPDAKTMTTRLPPASQITQLSPLLAGRIRLHYTSDNGAPASGELVSTMARSPWRRQLTCTPPPGSGGHEVTCRADHLWLRQLTQPVTVQLETSGAGVGEELEPVVTWIFVPAPPGPYIDQITGPGALTLGDLAEFTFRLTEPAPSNLTVEWKIDPGNCFSALPGNVPHQRGQSYSSFTVAQGQQYRSIALASEQDCSSTSATLRTWVQERIDQPPFYRTHRFRLQRPPR